jgi:PBP1b-binding outer membrane lipoprotein LpoB
MGSIVAIVAVLLALIAAGCIAYIAWELTSEDKPNETVSKTEPPDKL